MTQLKSIVGSCLKWWEIRYQNGENHGADNCPLCLNVEIDDKIICDLCPVKAKTGEGSCYNTPYTSYCDADALERCTNKPALEELNFLFDLIKPRYYANTRTELANGEYPVKFVRWMERAIEKRANL